MVEPLIELKDVSKSYGKNQVLNNISLKVAKGEVIVLIGPSGCGKSTLLRCLNGLEEIQGGSVLFRNEDLTAKNTDWKKNKTASRDGFPKLSFVPPYDGHGKHIIGTYQGTKTHKGRSVATSGGLTQAGRTVG